MFPKLTVPLPDQTETVEEPIDEEEAEAEKEATEDEAEVEEEDEDKDKPKTKKVMHPQSI